MAKKRTQKKDTIERLTLEKDLANIKKRHDEFYRRYREEVDALIAEANKRPPQPDRDAIRNQLNYEPESYPELYPAGVTGHLAEYFGRKRFEARKRQREADQSPEHRKRRPRDKSPEHRRAKKPQMMKGG